MKLSPSSDIKDQTKLEHKHDLTYLVKCPENSCLETYLGETARRLNEKIMEHSGKDKKSHMLKHGIISRHSSVSPNNSRSLQKRYNIKMKDIGNPINQETSTFVKHT